MVNIRMKQEMVRGGLSTSVESGWGGGPRDSLALEAEFAALWSDTWARGRLDIIGTRQMARLLQVVVKMVEIWPQISSILVPDRRSRLVGESCCGAAWKASVWGGCESSY